MNFGKLQRYQYAENEPIFLEEAAADVAIKTHPEIVSEFIDSLFKSVRPFRVLNGCGVKIHEVSQRVLVHRLQVLKGADCEEKRAAFKGSINVSRTGFIDFDFSLFRYDLLFAYFYRLLF